jgi:energy-coupling factor transport system substrate-specific component
MSVKNGNNTINGSPQKQEDQRSASSVNRWRGKDFITLAIFNVILIVVTMVVTAVIGLLFPGISYMIGYPIGGILTGPIYMVMANRINKRGVLLFTALIFGLFYLVMGLVYYLVVLVIGGIICELSMWGKDTYKSVPRNAVGYSLLYVFYQLSGVLPLVFFREQYLGTLSASYTAEQMDVMLYYYGTPHIVVITCVLAAIGATVGIIIGGAFVKRHIKKAKLV